MKKTTFLLAHLLGHCACRWASLGLFSALVFGPLPAAAAVTEAWVQRYSNASSDSEDQAFTIVCDAAGDIIVAGTADDRINGTDILTIKYSGADGSVLWQKRYNGPANGDDHARALAVDGRGNVVVTGDSYGTNFNADYYTAKYAAADGALLWEQRYNGPANSNDVANAVAMDSSGNVVVTGSSNNGTNHDCYTAKYAMADGALLWEKRYNGPANRDDVANAVAMDGSGNVVVTGYSGNSGFTWDNDYYTAKYSAADGALLWEKRYNSPANGSDSASAVEVDGSGNVVVTGYSGNSGYYWDNDYYTAKYAAADGALLWERRYNGPGNYDDRARSVAVDGNGNVVVTGHSYGTNVHYYDYYTAKYAAADGTLLWEKRYNGPANRYDVASAVEVDGSGNVVVTGYSYGTNFTADYYTAKYAAANGALLWEKRCIGGSASAVAVDSSGNVVVTGASDGPAGRDYYTARYAAADGALFWEKRDNGGPAHFNAQANAVAVDGSGNVVVTGSSATIKYRADGTGVWTNNGGGTALAVDGSGNVVVTGSSWDGPSYDYYTARYAAVDGALLWEQRYIGGSASAVAVDSSGNVVVTGSSNNGTNNDYYTAKYAAANGALLWEKRYNGGEFSNDDARAVAVDSSGNVVVTGSSDGDGSYVDYYTAKYAAADGALLWEKRFNRSVNDYDYGPAVALAVDGSGNVIVTGYSFDSASTPVYYTAYYTAKYAAADGALLWEQHYNAPANSSDNQARAVAVDGAGNVFVTGYSGIYPSLDYYTAKYASADGALLWEKRYNGPANSYDSASAVAVDNSGNVVVTGLSASGVADDFNFPIFDYYTAKYASSDGALLWEKSYNGPANGDDRVGSSRSLALGPNGMVAIAGSSDGNSGSGTTYDCATVVYRENLAPVSIALVPSGVRLRSTGIPGRSYNIERAPAITGPWSTINTQTAPTSGFLEYFDAPPSPAQAFYRTVQP